MSESKKPAALLSLGAIACAVCCSLPLLAGLGLGGATLTAIGAWAELAGVTLLGLGVLSAGLVFWRRRQAHGAACAIDCACRDRVQT